jgi:hypothetical protein
MDLSATPIGISCPALRRTSPPQIYSDRTNFRRQQAQRSLRSAHRRTDLEYSRSGRFLGEFGELDCQVQTVRPWSLSFAFTRSSRTPGLTNAARCSPAILRLTASGSSERLFSRSGASVRIDFDLERAPIGFAVGRFMPIYRESSRKRPPLGNRAENYSFQLEAHCSAARKLFAVFKVGASVAASAMGAAENSSILFDPMSDDPASALGTLRSERLDGKLEAIKNMSFPTDKNLESFLLSIPAKFTCWHCFPLV